MDNAGWFECPTCNARYDWQLPHAGRRVRCRCSTVLRIPTEANQPALVIDAPTQQSTPAPNLHSPEEPALPGGFAFSLETEQPTLANPAANVSKPAAESTQAHGSDTSSTSSVSNNANIANDGSRLRCANCGQSLSPSAAICVQCGTPVQSHAMNRPPADPSIGQAISQRIEEATPGQSKLSTQALGAQDALEHMRKRYEYDSDVQHEAVSKARFVDVFLPFILITLGLGMLVTYAMGYESPHQMLRIPASGHLLLAGLDILINFVFLFLGLLFVAKIFGDAIGTLGLTLWKLLALVIFCVAADAMFYWGLDVITEGFAMLGGYIRIVFRVLVFFPLAGWLLGMDFLQLVVLFIFGRLVPVMFMVFAAAIIYSLFE